MMITYLLQVSSIAVQPVRLELTQFWKTRQSYAILSHFWGTAV